MRRRMKKAATLTRNSRVSGYGGCRKMLRYSIVWVLGLLYGCSDKSPPGQLIAPVIPEFIGGIRDDAIIRKEATIDKVTEEFKTCLESKDKNGSKFFIGCVTRSMKKYNLSPQVIAFATKASAMAPSMDTWINEVVKPYSKDSNVAIVTVEQRWSNSPLMYYFITRTGQVVPVSSGVRDLCPSNPQEDQLEKLCKQHPSASIWEGMNQDPIQTSSRLPSGGEHFVMREYIQECHACEPLGHADIAFDFDKDGNYLGSKVLKIRVDTSEAAHSGSP
jgi:hypothetical protein